MIAAVSALLGWLPEVAPSATDPGVPTSVQISFAVTALFLVGWMIWGVRQYRRTGQATWLWLGVLMGIALVSGYARYPR